MSDFRELEKIGNRYDRFDCLLMYFFEDTYLEPEERDDKRTIQRYVNVETFDKADIQTTIIQGKEILELEPFPHEWIGDTADRLVYDADKKEWVDDPMLYKEWTRWIVDTLEEEARRAGKL
ncbi:hypothetical protein MIDIC_290002 [Alphaproteobacteria bacterium]